jgi:hypothetical protein
VLSATLKVSSLSSLISFIIMPSFISTSFFTSVIDGSFFGVISSFTNISTFLGDTHDDEYEFFVYSINPDFIILSNSCSILANFYSHIIKLLNPSLSHLSN